MKEEAEVENKESLSESDQEQDLAGLVFCFSGGLSLVRYSSTKPPRCHQ